MLLPVHQRHHCAPYRAVALDPLVLTPYFGSSSSSSRSSSSSCRRCPSKREEDARQCLRAQRQQSTLALKLGLQLPPQVRPGQQPLQQPLRRSLRAVSSSLCSGMGLLSLSSPLPMAPPPAVPKWRSSLCSLSPQPTLQPQAGPQRRSNGCNCKPRLPQTEAPPLSPLLDEENPRLEACSLRLPAMVNLSLSRNMRRLHSRLRSRLHWWVLIRTHSRVNSQGFKPSLRRQSHLRAVLLRVSLGHCPSNSSRPHSNPRRPRSSPCRRRSETCCRTKAS
mmetsp:Transcript_9454/g.28454  ORF Transcript_9454/g.28454 Transcript_9454/m.28454 type:complete len:277 (-) Transcript_9454:2143-2973(-)